MSGCWSGSFCGRCGIATKVVSFSESGKPVRFSALRPLSEYSSA
jgi:hypothetical protein